MAPDEIESSEPEDDELSTPHTAVNGPKCPAGPAPGKRRLSVEGEEDKVEWTDDDGSADLIIQKPRPRKMKRVRSSKGKKIAAASSRASAAARNRNDDDDDDDDDESGVPEYVTNRRKQFERERRALGEAALKIPPDCSTITFSADNRPGSLLERRPQFSQKSKIMQVREYKDIELEYSAGIIPASIAQYLRDYQVAGVRFLHQLFVYQKGGVLGDDMGLGKTIQIIAFLTAAFGKTADERDRERMRKVRQRGDRWYPRVLIICPGSIIENWRNELDRWGWWQCQTYHGSRQEREDVLKAAQAGWVEVMITTYDTYKNHGDRVNTINWDCVVADECHRIKDMRSQTTQAMNQVNALCRIGLTGTAIQNKYDELWTLLNWTNPGCFGTKSEWDCSITKPLTMGQSHDATLKQLSLARLTAKKLVNNLLPDVFLRRVKKLIADQLPKKSDKVVFCPLTETQKTAYENFLGGFNVEFIKKATEPCDCGAKRKRGWCCYKYLPDGRQWIAIVFPTIMTLQKLANNLTLLIPTSLDAAKRQKSELEALQTAMPQQWEELWQRRDWLITLADPKYCGKWKMLKKLLSFWKENGDKVLVFSHSVRLLNILRHLFQNTHYTVSYLTGELSYEERQRVVDEFNSDPHQFVFLISTKAGGVGLNMTSANKVVIFDPHWNPAHDLQAQDRAYRIGQTRDVDVFRMVSAGTIEEIVYARQIYKQQQANIGYTASRERRYFKGVQQQPGRRGEIFGLENLLSYRGDQVMLRDIVNKTNIAEAKAGVTLSDIDLEQGSEDEDEEDRGLHTYIKQEEGDGEDAGLSQLAKLLVAEDQGSAVSKAVERKPQSDAIAAILASAGVEYTHQNSEVIGSSKVEAQLSRRAELAAAAIEGKGHGGGSGLGDVSSRTMGGDSALFADTQANSVPIAGDGKVLQLRYNPPGDVMRRQFCSMAKEFGFASATDFALVVESWTQEQRRDCLDSFYKRRETQLLEMALVGVKDEEKKPVKSEVQQDEQSAPSRWATTIFLSDDDEDDDGEL